MDVMQIFRGYIRTNDKHPAQKFGSGEPLLSLEQASRLREYAGVLGGDITVKDIDDNGEAEKLYRIICDRNINCRVMKTSRGMQFFFKNGDGIRKNLTHVIDALGFEFDTRYGRNSYCVLKFNGILREILRDFDDSRPVSEYPHWLAPVRGGVSFTGMTAGSGRNGALYRHTGRLISNGYSKEEIRDICVMINDYAFDEPLPAEELAKILRDETFDNFSGITAADEFRSSCCPPDFSDTGTASVFAREYLETVRFCPAYGWLVWNGKVWELSDLKAQQSVIDFTGKMLGEAVKEVMEVHAGLALAEMGEDEAAKERVRMELKNAQAYHKFCLKMREHSKITGVQKLARSALEISVYEIDADGFLLNTPGGIVDLHTGRITPHRAEAYCTKITRFAPGTGCIGLWMECLDAVTGGDGEFKAFLQYLAGAMSIGKVYHEALVIAHGDGANGKSTFFNTIAEVLGDYAGKIPAEALTTRAKSVKVDLAELAGKRFVLASETEEGQRLSTSMLKQIASVDTITAERKYRDPFTFIPTHTAVLYTNHLPKVGSGDSGTWRRLVVAPFHNKITNPRTDFAEKLLEKAGGAVMSWIIEGAQKFIKGGCRLPPCRAVDAAVEEYRESCDWFGMFLEERCETGKGREVYGGVLYQAYREWALRQGEYVRGTSDFTNALQSAGFERKKTPKGMIWRGISLVAESHAEEDFL